MNNTGIEETQEEIPLLKKRSEEGIASRSGADGSKEYESSETPKARATSWSQESYEATRSWVNACKETRIEGEAQSCHGDHKRKLENAFSSSLPSLKKKKSSMQNEYAKDTRKDGRTSQADVRQSSEYSVSNQSISKTSESSEEADEPSILDDKPMHFDWPTMEKSVIPIRKRFITLTNIDISAIGWNHFNRPKLPLKKKAKDKNSKLIKSNKSKKNGLAVKKGKAAAAKKSKDTKKAGKKVAKNKVVTNAGNKVAKKSGNKKKDAKPAKKKSVEKTRGKKPTGKNAAVNKGRSIKGKK